MRASRFRYLAALLPLLLGADGPPASVPDCAADEFLTVQAGMLTCIGAFANSTPRLPICQGYLLSTVYSGPKPYDPTREVWRCVPQDIATQAQLDLLSATEQGLAKINGTLATLQQSPVGAPVWAGNTDVRTTGKITRGALGGLLAANALCNDKYPGAHMCNSYEMYNSAISNVVQQAMTVPTAWVFAPSGKDPSGVAMEPTAGLADNCAGYTYDADDRGWSGVAAEWTVLSTGQPGLKFHGGPEARCSQPLPIACCR